MRIKDEYKHFRKRKNQVYKVLYPDIAPPRNLLNLKKEINIYTKIFDPNE